MRRILRIVAAVAVVFVSVALALISGGCKGLHGVDAGINGDGSVHFQIDVDPGQLLKR